jgi:hypothetical protein
MGLPFHLIQPLPCFGEFNFILSTSMIEEGSAVPIQRRLRRFVPVGIAMLLLSAASLVKAQPGIEFNPCGASFDSLAVHPQSADSFGSVLPAEHTSGLFPTEDGLIVYDAN